MSVDGPRSPNESVGSTANPERNPNRRMTGEGRPLEQIEPTDRAHRFQRPVPERRRPRACAGDAPVAERPGVPALRWGGMVPAEQRHTWQCKACDKQTLVTAGKVMQRSKVPLCKWFPGPALVVTHNSFQDVRLNPRTF